MRYQLICIRWNGISGRCWQKQPLTNTNYPTYRRLTGILLTGILFQWNKPRKRGERALLDKREPAKRCQISLRKVFVANVFFVSVKQASGLARKHTLSTGRVFLSGQRTTIKTRVVATLQSWAAFYYYTNINTNILNAIGAFYGTLNYMEIS